MKLVKSLLVVGLLGSAFAATDSGATAVQQPYSGPRDTLGSIHDRFDKMQADRDAFKSRREEWKGKREQRDSDIVDIKADLAQIKADVAAIKNKLGA